MGDMPQHAPTRRAIPALMGDTCLNVEMQACKTRLMMRLLARDLFDA
jgi:hypothetical protein